MEGERHLAERLGDVESEQRIRPGEDLAHLGGISERAHVGWHVGDQH